MNKVCCSGLTGIQGLMSEGLFGPQNFISISTKTSALEGIDS
jgi:hypothetical protein